MSTGNIVVSQDAPAKNNLWIQPKGTARFWNGSIWKTISGGGGDITLVDLMGSSAIGTQYSPLYWTGSVFSPITYTLSSTVNAGTANYLAYYNSSNQIDDSNIIVDTYGLKINYNNSYYRLYNNNYDIGLHLGSGGSNRGIYSWLLASWLQYWDSDNYENHNQKVGINGKNTSYDLYVNGTSCFNSTMKVTSIDTNRAILELISNGDYPIDLKLGRNNTAKWSLTSRNSTDADAFYLYSYVQSKAAIFVKNDSTLNVGIGTNSPSYKLDVAGDIKSSNQIRSIGAGEHYFEAQNSTTTQKILLDSASNVCGLWSNGYVNSSSTFVTGSKWLLYRNTSNEVELTGPVKVSGDFYATGAVTALQSSSSDKRLKKNIKLFNAIEIVDKLKPIQFEWNIKAKKYNENFKDGKNYGLIAQDSDGIIDNLVFDLPDNSGYKGVRYEKLIPILLQAIKELKEEVEKLKNKKT